MRRLLPLAPILILVLTTGCAGTTTAASTTPPAVPLEQPSSTTSGTPTPAPVTPAAIGATQDSRGDTSSLKATILRVRQPFRAVVPGLPERSSHEYIGVEVRMCVVTNTGPEVSVSWSPWSIAFADDTVAQALSGWSAEWWTEPLYPQDRAMRPGQCVRGWIPFEAQKGSKPATISYQPDAGGHLEWRVKK